MWRGRAARTVCPCCTPRRHPPRRSPLRGAGTPSTADAPASRISQLAPRAARETAHLLLDLPVGIVGFTVVLTGLATGASLAITLAGVPLLAAVLLLARHAAGLERARARTLLDVSLAAPPPRATGLLLLAATPLVIHAITHVDRALLGLLDR